MSEDLLEIRMVTRTLKTPIGNLYPFIRQNKLLFSEVEKQVFEYFDGREKRLNCL